MAPPGYLSSAGNQAIQRLLLGQIGRASHSQPSARLASTRDGITTLQVHESIHPLSEFVNVHESIHRAQHAGNWQGLPKGNRSELEDEAVRGARVLLGGGVFSIRKASVFGETYALDDQATWYQRATGFSSGMESIENVIKSVSARTQEEQSDTYVLSDRIFTRPVVNRILAGARAFRTSASSFIDTSPADEPMLGQLREDLQRLDAAIADLVANTPATVGTPEIVGRSFVGGVTGAAGSFLGFLRLGLWDSWGQFLFDGSKQRADEAGEGFYQLLVSVGDRGFGSTVSQYGSDWGNRFTENIENERFTTAGQQFGATAFDIYFAGRGLVSAGKGLAGMSRAAELFRAAGNPAPWRAAFGLAIREAVAFRGVGATGGSGFWGSQYGLPTVGPNVPRVRIIRFIKSEQDLVAKVMRQPPELTTQGQPRSPADIIEQHRSASRGSPFQSAYPFADAETMMAANPEGFSAVQRSPYYVVLEVPMDQGLVDVNRHVLGLRGVDPAQFPEFSANRYGVSLPDELRPTDLNSLRPQSIYDPPHAHLPPELQAWVRANTAIPENGPAASALEGVPFNEWEQVALAPDLRPYVVEIRPNPAFTGTRPPLSLRVGMGSPYSPSLNPLSLSDLARGSPQGLTGFTNYMDWLSSQTGLGAGRVPFSMGQVQGGGRLAYLGGIQPELNFPFVLPQAQIATVLPPTSPPAREITNQDALAYLAWINGASGQTVSPEVTRLLAQPNPRGLPASPDLMSNAVGAISTSASRLRQAGDRITRLRSGPGVISLEVHTAQVNQVSRVVNSILDEWGRDGRDIEAGIVIVVDEANPSAAAIPSQMESVSLPRSFHVNVVNSGGISLYSR